MDWKKFREPLQEEFRWNPHGILNLSGALGNFPAIMVGYHTGSIWAGFGFFAAWYCLVYFSYLTYRYLK